jgi:hypothetical protein
MRIAPGGAQSGATRGKRRQTTLKGSNRNGEAALTAGSTLSGLELALSGYRGLRSAWLRFSPRLFRFVPSGDSKHFKTADPPVFSGQDLRDMLSLSFGGRCFHRAAKARAKGNGHCPFLR